MAHANSFKVGLFVLLGLALGALAVVYLGAKGFMQGSKTYVSYFNESVQGLQLDSLVKYRGVGVGRVKAIRVAPDMTLIAVVMEIEFDEDPTQQLVARLRSAGITGLTFIELDRQGAGDLQQSPKLNFVSEYPIIPSRPSEVSQIMGVVEKLAHQLERVDLPAAVDAFNTSMATIQEVMRDKRIHTTLVALQDFSQQLQRIGAKVEEILYQKPIPQIMDEAHRVVKGANQTVGQAQEILVRAQGVVDGADQLMAQLQKDLEALDLPGVRREMGRELTRVGDQGTQAMLTLNRTLEVARQTTENLRRASRQLDRLTRRLEQDPSAVIFSQPPAERTIPAGGPEATH